MLLNGALHARVLRGNMCCSTVFSVGDQEATPMAVYNIEKYRNQMRKLIGFNRDLTGQNYDAALAVKCHNGTFVGSERDGVLSYKGIPYAMPPVGSRRWKAPEDAAPDDGVYEACFFGRSCIQTEEASEKSSGKTAGKKNVGKKTSGRKTTAKRSEKKTSGEQL